MKLNACVFIYIIKIDMENSFQQKLVLTQFLVLKVKYKKIGLLLDIANYIL